MLVSKMLTGLLAFLAISPFALQPPAAQAQGDYGPVILRARVLDRRDRPVSGVRVRLQADLDGVSRDADGQTCGLTLRPSGTVVTDARGVATLTVAGPAGSRDWFAGREIVQATVADPDPAVAVLDPAPRQASLRLPEDEATPVSAGRALADLTLRTFDPPDRRLDGCPLWGDMAGRGDRIVVLIGGFDPYHVYGQGNLMRLIGPLGDALRASGVSLLVITLADCSQAPDAQAPAVTRAIRAAAAASGHTVVVAGISEGGLVARWALVSAEQQGTPLPVSTYLSLDVPNRGANMNPGLQAMVARYGKAADRAALVCPAATAMMNARPAHVVWKTLGLPGAARSVPVAWDDDTGDSRAFFTRLWTLNDRRGYPKGCRLVAVANGSRSGAGGGPELLHLWLPWNYCWTQPARLADRAPGSLLPSFFVSRFLTQVPLGLAGAYLRTAPTFIPTASALDAGPSETPPFDAWYARPEGLPPLAHDQFSPEEGAFIVRELLRTDWKPYRP